MNERVMQFDCFVDSDQLGFVECSLEEVVLPSQLQTVSSFKQLVP